jgi:hypothetical protein
MKCAVCKSEINEGAELCPICRSHQSVFKRNVFYMASITGFLLLLVSALGFIISKASEIKKELVWQDHLQIISFMSDGFQVYLNNGDGDIFLSHVRIKSSSKNETTVLINTIVEKNKFLKYKVSSSVPEPSSPVTPYEKDYQNIKPYRNTNCVGWSYFNLDDPRYLQYKSFLEEQLVSVDAQAILYYFSIHDGQEKNIIFPVRGILFRSMSNECRETINKITKNAL